VTTKGDDLRDAGKTRQDTGLSSCAVSDVGDGAPLGDGATSAGLKHLVGAAVDTNVRLSARLQRAARLLTVGLMGSLAFLMGHAPPQPPPAGQAGASPEALSQAWSLAEDAQNLAAAHQPRVALVSWQRAYELSSDPTLLLEVARLEREVGNAARATHAFELFLARGGGRVSEQRKLFAARQLQAAATNTARLTIQTNVLGASVELEPERGVATGSGFVVSVLIDAGERRLSLSKPGYETQTRVLTLEPGEVRALRVDLDKAAAGRSETGSSKPRWSLLDRVTVAAGG
jgi:hypothetical protein